MLEPLEIFELLRQDWSSHDPSGSPEGDDSSRGHAKVFASSFGAFVDEVLKVLPSLNLPVVTGACSRPQLQGLENSTCHLPSFSKI